MFRKPRARLKSPKPGTDRTRRSRLRLAGSANLGGKPKKAGKAAKRPAKRLLHPPPEEDLGGGDICSLEEKPSTEDNMPLVAHAPPDSIREAEFEDDHAKRSRGAAAIALLVAVLGTLSLLIIDHAPWGRPYPESARARAATEAAVNADGAFVTPTRRPSLYSRLVR